MTIPFRIIDTGVREGRAQIAFDEALVELRAEDAVPDTLRFLRFPPTVLIGRHQALSHEIKLDHCRANGIGIVRRITGGGAIYLDDNQLGWELVFKRSTLPLENLGAYTQRICGAVAAGLSAAFGIDARFRPRNDIEVGGRKLCGTGGFFDGDTLIYQGTVLVDVDPAAMMACLNVPQGKLLKRDLDKAEQRVTTLKALLGEAPGVGAVQQAVIAGLAASLGIAPVPSQITAAEEVLAAKHHSDVIGTDEFVYEIDDPGGADVLSASRTTPGGTVAAYLRLEGTSGARRIREALITGDFFVTPPRMVYDLEAALRGVGVEDAGGAVDRFFAINKPDMLTIAPADFKGVIDDALAQATGAS